MRFGILGPLEARTDDGRPVAVREKKVRALLARLLADPGRAVSADRLIADLWDGEPPADPRAALHTKISLLRRAIAPVAVERVGDAYRIEADTDAAEFTALTDRAAALDGADRAALLEQALGLWRGPALAEFDHLTAPAAALDDRRLTARADLVDARLDLGRTDGLPAETADLTAARPRSERLHALHLRALYATGRHTEALDAYRRLRDRLAADGLEPGRELQDLHRAILRHDPALDAAPAPTGPPAPLTPLIGREADLDALGDRLAAARLVTLTGPGGVGKTSLALAAARAHDRARFVDLGGHADDAGPDLLAAAVADALGLRRGTGTPAARAPAPEALLRAALDGADALIVLDNCEHVAEAAAELCRRLLASRGVRILATSREPLRLPGEHVQPLAPLGLPETADAAAVAKAPAVRLFTARARAADPAFALTDANAADVAAICARLDGLPLALELAATRAAALGTGHLAAELADRLLTAESRGLPERQRSLRAVIDWSWDLLGPAERRVLTRLAVATGGAALDAVTALCEDALDPAAAADALAALVDRSLVVVAPGEDRRYRLLASVAVYGRDRLAETGGLDAARRRHRDVYTRLAETAADALRGPAQAATLRALDAETANLRTALDTSLRLGDADAALRLAVGLTWYWYLRSDLPDAVRALDAALALDGPAGPGLREAARFWRHCFTVITRPGADRAIAEDVGFAAALTDARHRARAELFIASTMIGFDDHGEAERLSRRAREHFAAAGDTWGLAAADANLAWFALVRGDMRPVLELAEAARERFAALGDGWGALQALEPLAAHAEITGDYGTALERNHEALAIADELGLRLEQAYRQSRLGRVAMLRGEFDEARRLHRRALAAGRELSVAFIEMFADTGLMLLERRAGDLDAAEGIARRWLDRIERAPGLHESTAMLLDELGFAAEMRGDGAEALRLHRRALALSATRLDGRAAALSLEGLAGAWSLLGEPRSAARALGTAAALREARGAPLPQGERFDLDRIEPRLAAALGPDGYAAERALGRAAAPLDYLSE
ncbi:MAG TPA: BTAD domain-containing putative transcriptional regulator [Glycomyces sp.]|nr:BTAD domain-containing putative transcriptional regulator [Glycomyces sp.]